MSGPKTSQLEIERMIRAQLEALRSDVDHSRARARRRIAALLNELLNEAKVVPKPRKPLPPCGSSPRRPSRS